MLCDGDCVGVWCVMCGGMCVMCARRGGNGWCDVARRGGVE